VGFIINSHIILKHYLRVIFVWYKYKYFKSFVLINIWIYFIQLISVVLMLWMNELQNIWIRINYAVNPCRIHNALWEKHLIYFILFLIIYYWLDIIQLRNWFNSVGLYTLIFCLCWPRRLFQCLFVLFFYLNSKVTLIWNTR
jgi:hypothetical protein